MTQQSLCDLQTDDWKELKLPVGLASQMRKKLKHLGETKENIDPQPNRQATISSNEVQMQNTVEMNDSHTQTDDASYQVQQETAKGSKILQE